MDSTLNNNVNIIKGFTRKRLCKHRIDSKKLKMFYSTCTPQTSPTTMKYYPSTPTSPTSPTTPTISGNF